MPARSITNCQQALGQLIVDLRGKLLKSVDLDKMQMQIRSDLHWRSRSLSSREVCREISLIGFSLVSSEVRR